MSLLTGMAGLAGTPGAIDFQDSSPIAVFWRGVPFDASTRICCQIDASGTIYKDGFLHHANGMICYSLVGSIHHYNAGIPCTEAGAICIENAAAVNYVQGVPLTASGRVAFV